MNRLVFFLCVGFSATIFGQTSTISTSTSNEEPIIVKISSTGLVDADDVRIENCTVYTNGKVTKAIRYGEDKSSNSGYKILMTESFDTVAVGDFTKLSQEAKTENLTNSSNTLCDGPTTLIHTYENRATIPLYFTGGCGLDKIVRTGPASRILMDIVNNYCQLTYK